MRHFKNFVLAALTFGFFLGLGFSRGLLLQEDSIRINPDLAELVIAVDDVDYFSPSTVLELEKIFARKVEIRKIGDSADLAPQLTSQNPPHLILSSLVNLNPFTNGEFSEISATALDSLHSDFNIANANGPRKDVLVAFWGYAVLESSKNLSIKSYFEKRPTLKINLDNHSRCNWRIKLSDELKVSKELLQKTDSAADLLQNTLVPHAKISESNFPIEGTILWKKAFVIPQTSPDLKLSQKALEVITSPNFFLAWIQKLPAAGALKFLDTSSIQANKKPQWLRSIDLNKMQKDKICPPEWRDN